MTGTDRRNVVNHLTTDNVIVVTRYFCDNNYNER